MVNNGDVVYCPRFVLAAGVMRFAGPASADPARDVAAVHAWSGDHTPQVKAARRVIEDIEKAGGPWSFAKLTIANAALRDLAGAWGGLDTQSDLDRVSLFLALAHHGTLELVG